MTVLFYNKIQVISEDCLANDLRALNPSVSALGLSLPIPKGRGFSSPNPFSGEIVSGNSRIATEKLNIKGMTKKAKKGSKRKRQKTGLNRSILDVGIGNLKSLIKYKVTEAGGFYVEVPTRKVKPSQTCPNCGHQKKKTLAQRVHSCEKCGYECDRDVAAAKVMLDRARGMERASLDVDENTSTYCGSFKKVSQGKRQKQLSQRSG